MPDALRLSLPCVAGLAPRDLAVLFLARLYARDIAALPSMLRPDAVIEIASSAETFDATPRGLARLIDRLLPDGVLAAMGECRVVSDGPAVACEHRLVVRASETTHNSYGLAIVSLEDGLVSRVLFYTGPALAANDAAALQSGSLNRRELIVLTLDRYFASVDGKNLEDSLACFHDDASFSIGTADVSFHGKAEISRMLADYFAGYQTIEHRDFTVIADVERQSVAAHFNGFLIANDGQRMKLHNSNVWHVRNGLFEKVTVYMSGTNVLK